MNRILIILSLLLQEARFLEKRWLYIMFAADGKTRKENGLL